MVPESIERNGCLQEHGSSYELMYRLKDAMDPNGILNKGDLLVEK